MRQPIKCQNPAMTKGYYVITARLDLFRETTLKISYPFAIKQSQTSVKINYLFVKLLFGVQLETAEAYVTAERHIIYSSVLWVGVSILLFQ